MKLKEKGSQICLAEVWQFEGRGFSTRKPKVTGELSLEIICLLVSSKVNLKPGGTQTGMKYVGYFYPD